MSANSIAAWHTRSVRDLHDLMASAKSLKDAVKSFRSLAKATLARVEGGLDKTVEAEYGREDSSSYFLEVTGETPEVDQSDLETVSDSLSTFIDYLSELNKFVAGIDLNRVEATRVSEDEDL